MLALRRLLCINVVNVQHWDVKSLFGRRICQWLARNSLCLVTLERLFYFLATVVLEVGIDLHCCRFIFNSSFRAVSSVWTILVSTRCCSLGDVRLICLPRCLLIAGQYFRRYCKQIESRSLLEIVRVFWISVFSWRVLVFLVRWRLLWFLFQYPVAWSNLFLSELAQVVWLLFFW